MHAEGAVVAQVSAHSSAPTAIAQQADSDSPASASKKAVSFNAQASAAGGPKPQRFRRGSLHVKAALTMKEVLCIPSPHEPETSDSPSASTKPFEDTAKPLLTPIETSAPKEESKPSKYILEYGHGGVYHQKVKPKTNGHHHHDKPVATHVPGAPLVFQGSDNFNHRFETTNEMFNREVRLAQARENRRCGGSRGSSRGSSRGGSRCHSPTPDGLSSPGKDRDASSPASFTGDSGSSAGSPLRPSSVLSASGQSSLMKDHSYSPGHHAQSTSSSNDTGSMTSSHGMLLQENAQRIVAALIEASMQSLKHKSDPLAKDA